MATLFHNCSLLGFVPLEALEGLKYTEGVARRIATRGAVKCARRSRAIYYKINDDVCGFQQKYTEVSLVATSQYH